MSKRFGTVATIPYNGIPAANPTNICKAITQAPQSVPIIIDWNVPWQALGQPSSCGVTINLSGNSPNATLLDAIKTIKIDNTFSTCPLYAYFPDTQDTVSCAPQTVATLTVNTNASRVIIYAENLAPGFIPYTVVYFYNVLLPPVIDPAIQYTYPQWQGSPLIQRNATQILTPGFNAPALGDQAFQARLDLGSSAGAVSLFNTPFTNGNIIITAYTLQLYANSTSTANNPINLYIESIGAAGNLLKWENITVQSGVYSGAVIPISSMYNLNWKLDATQSWQFRFASSVALGVNRLNADLILSYSFTGLTNGRTGVAIVPVMSANTVPVPFVASADDTFANQAPWKLFDNNPQTYWQSTLAQAHYVKIDTGTPQYVYSYSMQGLPSTATPSLSPSEWTFDYSLDGTNWTTAQSQSGYTFDASQIYNFSLGILPVYGRYFRLANMAARNTGLAAWQLYG